jgi:hypothetical protein
MSDFMPFFLIVILMPSSVIGGVVWGSDALQARSCAIYTEETGIETKYRHFDECYLKTPSGWMPWSEFKARAMTKEAAK